MSNLKLTKKQKKIGLSVLIVIAVLLLAVIKGKDLTQVFQSLFPDGISSEEALDTEHLGDTISDLLTNDTPSPTPEINSTNAPTAAPTDTPEPTPTNAPTSAPTATPEPTPTNAPTPAPTATSKPTPNEAPTPAPTEAPDESVKEDGIYTTPDLVAAYLHTFHKLPSNFITKKEATALGWDNSKGNLWDVTDGMSIGGDRFGNYEGTLPDKKDRTWYECDVNYNGGYRGAERIVYSNDGLIYYTDDHYETFTQLY